jgi:hypothetical protein
MGEQHANGSRVSRHRRPAWWSGLTAASGAPRGGLVLVSTDTSGVSAAVQPELFTQVGAGTCSPRRRTAFAARPVLASCHALGDWLEQKPRATRSVA